MIRLCSSASARRNAFSASTAARFTSGLREYQQDVRGLTPAALGSTWMDSTCPVAGAGTSAGPAVPTCRDLEPGGQRRHARRLPVQTVLRSTPGAAGSRLATAIVTSAAAAIPAAASNHRLRRFFSTTPVRNNIHAHHPRHEISQAPCHSLGAGSLLRRQPFLPGCESPLSDIGQPALC